MSSSRNVHSQRTSGFHRRQARTFTKTPFCTVCIDAGRPDANTHFVRDRPGGKVVCPYLLSLECGYCGEVGHTPSHCPILKRNSQEARQHRLHEERIQRKPRIDGDGFIAVSRRSAPSKPPVAVASGQKRKHAVGFAALADDSDSEDEDLLQKPIGFQTPSIVQPMLSGWAAVTAKAPVTANAPVTAKAAKIERLQHLIKEAKPMLAAMHKKPAVVPKPAVVVPKPAVVVAAAPKDSWWDSDEENDDAADQNTSVSSSLRFPSLKNGSWADECDSDLED